jgi:predicted deacylase
MFSRSYTEARDTFRAAAQRVGASLEALEVVPAEQGEPEGLTIDIATLGTGPGVLVLSSGLHGVEGFAGSAIQLQMLSEPLPEGVRLVLLHALNPFGMHHIRRVNESNVDLNRNFLGPGDDYAGCAEAYRDMNHMLNPARCTRSVELFIFEAIWKIIRHGMPKLKTALLGGQYTFDKGLFFGGAQLERGPALILQHLPRLLQDAERMVHIDFHTGLGKSGTYKLLIDAEPGSKAHIRLRQTYGEQIQPWDAGHGVAYKITGGMPEAVARLFGDTIDVLTCEFGTISSLGVIDALREENQQFHWGGDKARAKRKLLAAFRPDSRQWEQQVLGGGRQVIEQAISTLRQADAPSSMESAAPA